MVLLLTSELPKSVPTPPPPPQKCINRIMQSSSWRPRIAKVSKSLSRTLSLPKRCRICGKIVYFKSLRCRLCNYVSHRQCVEHNEQWHSDRRPDAHFGWETFKEFGSNKAREMPPCKGHCPPATPSVVHHPANVTAAAAASQCVQSDDDDECDSLCRHQLHATDTLITGNSEMWNDMDYVTARQAGLSGGGGSANSSPSNTSKLTKSEDNDELKNVNRGGAGLYRKIFCWLTNRKLQQFDVPASAAMKGRSISLKHPKEKYHGYSGLGGVGDTENQMIRKRLKLFLSSAGRRLSTSSQHSAAAAAAVENIDSALLLRQQQQQQQLRLVANQHQLQLQLRHQRENQLPPPLHTNHHHHQPNTVCAAAAMTSSPHDANVFPCSGSAVFVHRDSGISSLSSSVAQTPCFVENVSILTSSTTSSTISAAKNRFVQAKLTSAATAICSAGFLLHHHHHHPQQQQQQQGIPLERNATPNSAICKPFTSSSAAAAHLTRDRQYYNPQHATFPHTVGHNNNNHHHHHHHHHNHHRPRPPKKAAAAAAIKTPTTISSNDNQLMHSNCELLEGGGRFSKLCSSKTRNLSLESKNEPRDNVCVTWPPIGRKYFGGNDDLEGSESGFEDYETDDDPNSAAYKQSPTNVKDMLGEWSIPFRDLVIGRQLRRGRCHDIYRGRWHGEVMIHIYRINSEQETTQFWKEVTSLSMIRHENVALFMGVCIDMPQLAIITSVRKGGSLFDHIHVNKDHFPLAFKVQIARQIAQAMSYLHAKGIVHRKLNSKNILLENKVKVCLLDQGMAQKDFDRVDYGCVPKGHLTYVSPEAMKSLHVEPPRVVSTVPYTKSSDVYAFGTVLYELFAEQWPFQGQKAHSVIWQVANGQTQSLTNIKCTLGIKTLLSECWATDPSCRSNFHNILRALQQNVSLQRRHSTSEPDSLNRVGFGKMTGLLPC